jgi:hypothetical protein
VIVDFYQMETIFFNIICHLRLLLAMTDRYSVLSNIVSWSPKSTPFWVLFNRVLGTCATCYCYYCPTLLTVLRLYFHELSVHNSLQTITTFLCDINVKVLSLGNGDESEKLLTYIFCSNDFHSSLLKYCTRALNHPVYVYELIISIYTVYFPVLPM